MINSFPPLLCSRSPHIRIRIQLWQCFGRRYLWAATHLSITQRLSTYSPRAKTSSMSQMSRGRNKASANQTIVQITAHARSAQFRARLGHANKCFWLFVTMNVVHSSIARGVEHAAHVKCRDGDGVVDDVCFGWAIGSRTTGHQLASWGYTYCFV